MTDDAMVPKEKRKRKKCWSFSVGRRGFRVAVREEYPGSNLYIAMRDPELPPGSPPRSRSLGHRDREKAMETARAANREWEASGLATLTHTVTLGSILVWYQKFITPGKSPAAQENDVQKLKLWENVLGRHVDVGKLDTVFGTDQWKNFLQERAAGAIGPHGEEVPADKRIPIRKSSAGADLAFLVAVLNAAMNRVPPLIKLNPYANRKVFPIPHEKNARRPVVYHDRHLKIMAAVRESPELSGSMLADFLPLLEATGHRFSPVVSLRYRDLHLNTGPFGSILWPAETDKQHKEHWAPLSEDGRTAINAILKKRPPFRPDGLLFPDIKNPDRPYDYDRMAALLEKAERIAGVPKQDGSLFHAYRRKFGSERKNKPDVDVMALGGWKDLDTLKSCYQQADQGSMLDAIQNPDRLREVSQS